MKKGKMKIRNLIIGLLFSFGLFAQINFHELRIIQINAQNTTKKHTSLIQRFDNNRNLIYEKYQGYKTDYQNGRVNGEYFYRYTDDRLIEKLFVEKSRIDEGFDTTKTVISYEMGEMIEEKTYKFTSRVSPNYKGCQPRYPEDFLPKQWYLIGEKKFFYDKNGMLIEEYAPEKFYTSQNRYKYDYDSEERLINRYSYDDDRLIWTENHEYNPKRETMRRIWEHEGKVEKWTNPLYWRFEKYYDDNGNLIREECFYDKLEDENVFHSLDKYEYDETNRLIRFVSFGKEKEPQIIHEYEYK